MPLIDMPLKELREYNGINPKPKDFESYWDESIKEVDSIDPKAVFEKSTFHTKNADCYDLTFTSVGNAKIYAKFLAPKDKENIRGAILMFHGYTGSSGDWHDKINYVNEGYVVAAMDCRGQGGYSEDTSKVIGNTHRGHIIRGLLNEDPKKLLFRSIFLDTRQLSNVILALPYIPSDNIMAIGGSQGGALTIACAALQPKIKKCAPSFPFLCDYKRVWEMDLDLKAYAELREFFRHFDPTHEKEDEYFRRLGYIDLQHLANRIKGEVLMGTGLMDDICPPSTQFAMFNKIKSKKDVIIYPDFGHEYLPGFNDKAFMFLTSY